MTSSVRLTRRRLSMAAAARMLEGPGLGGVVLFAGTVRADPRGGRRVRAIDYEVHARPALEVMQRLGRDVHDRYGVERAVVWHRVGRVPSGEIAVIVGVAAGHRAPAFAAARYLIDVLKQTVPIWKTERAGSRRPPTRARPSRAGRRPG